MKILQATRDFGFSSPIFGEGRLEKGKTYYTFGKFARDISSMNAGDILEYGPTPRLFSTDTLKDLPENARVLLIHSGGYGDTITVGILLALLKREYGIRFDVCGHRDKWESILKPLGFEGAWLPYPTSLEILEPYDYVITELAAFVSDPSLLLKHSPLKILADIFNVKVENHEIQFLVPEGIKKRLRLPWTKRIRIGLNFDSLGAVRSYPPDLHLHLLKELLRLNFETHCFGTNTLDPKIDLLDHRIHNHTARTNILELSALLDQMDLVIGVDSFVAHLSGILGKETLVLLSTTGSDIFEPYKRVGTLTSRLDCAPCYHAGNSCPQKRRQCAAFYHESVLPDCIVLHAVEKIARGLGEKHGR